MYEKFESLSDEKKQRIISAALEVFSKKPYKDALMEDIAAIAGVSKGSLFFYFKSKKELFIYIYDYHAKIITGYMNEVGFSEPDFFKRMDTAKRMEFELLKKHPHIYGFFQMTARADDNEIAQALMTRFDITFNYEKFFEGIDTSKFRQDTDLGLAINLFLWIKEGLSREFLNNKVELESILISLDAYMDILKKGLYREEYLNE